MKTRDVSFDVMKGIAIYAVVMGHVIGICIREIDNTALFRIISLTHMPLFFFISGFFSYKATDNRAFLSPNLIARFKQLMIPMLVVSTLYFYYMPHSGISHEYTTLFGTENPLNLWFSATKYGYWFPLCLFELMLIYALMCPVLRRTASTKLHIGLLIFVYAGLMGAYFVTPEAINHLLGLQELALYFPVFMIGVLARRHKAQFEKSLKSGVLTTLAIVIGGMLLSMLMYRDQSIISFYGSKFIFTPVWHLCLAVIAFAVVKRWVQSATEGGNTTKSVRIWSWLGRNSLGIYLLHYFFLFPLPMLQPAFTAMSLQIVPSFVFSFVIAAPIVAITCGVIAIIRTSHPLSTWLIGDTH